MNHNSGGWMDGMNGWAGGEMWIGMTIGILVVVLLTVLIMKVSKK